LRPEWLSSSSFDQVSNNEPDETRASRSNERPDRAVSTLPQKGCLSMEEIEPPEALESTPPWERGSAGKKPSWRSRLKADLLAAGSQTRATLASLRAALPHVSSPPAAAAPSAQPPSPRERTTSPAPLAALLAAPRADLAALRRTVADVGCDDAPPGARIAAWQLLLGVAPLPLSARAAEAAAQRDNYARLVRELVLEPSSASEAGGEEQAGGGGCAAAGDLPAVTLSGDHPLATAADSVWHRHFRDAELREQIGRDVERTQRNMHWFSADGAEGHRAAQCRALFVFAATNKGVRYVQGMNELLAPLYYLCATAPGAACDQAPGGAQPAPAEADAFHCFVPLLSELRDLFCAAFDGSGEGVAGTLGRLSALLRLQDAALWGHLEVKCGVNPQFYAFRWITTAFTQEYLLPDTLRLWDFLFGAADGPREALLRVAAAMVLAQRENILASDFATNLKMLQAYPPTDVGAILRRAAALPPAPPAAGTGPVSAEAQLAAAEEEEGWDRMKALAAAARAAAAWRGGGGGGLGWRIGGRGGAGGGAGGDGSEKELGVLEGKDETEPGGEESPAPSPRLAPQPQPAQSPPPLERFREEGDPWAEF